MRLHTATVCAAAVLLAACSDPRKASEANFKQALDAYLADQGRLCLGRPGGQWPQRLLPGQKPATRGGMPNEAMRLATLAEVGMVRAETIDEGRAAGQPLVQYHLTDKAAPFVRTHKSEVMRGHQDLCFAKRTVDKVVQWEGPMAFGEYQVARVTFTWRPTETAEWATHAAVKAAFPEIERRLASQDRQDQRQLHLTSNGWQAQ